MTKDTLIEIFERVLASDEVVDLDLDMGDNEEENVGVRISFSFYPKGDME